MDEEKINHPSHYQSGDGIEVIDIIESFGLDYHEGNIVKYILRWRKKGGMEDLSKCRWYLNRLIERQEAKK